MDSNFCPCCGSQNLKIHVSEPKDREYFVERSLEARILRCQQCSSLFQNPLPDPSETNSFYHANYQNYEGSKVPLLAILFRVLQSRGAKSFLKSLTPDSAILDFGCNQGAFLRSLRHVGCSDLTGYDVVPLKEAASDFAFFSDLGEITRSRKKFDVIRMNHVIEHLPELDKTMRILRDLLKPSGKIVGQTPNAAHYTSDLMGSYWGALHYPYHLILFSPAGLASAAARWNLTLTATTPSLMPTGWAMSLENWIKSKTSSRVVGRTAFYVIYLIATAPMVIFDRIFPRKDRSAIMDFILVRE